MVLDVMALDERLYRILEADKATLQEQVFTNPPKTMEEFAKRLGKWQQIDSTLKVMVDLAHKDDDKEKDSV